MPSYLETAVEIAREAGGLIATLFERRVPFELKGEYDLVTEADRASERLIVERLRTHFPSHAIVAEEGGGHESSSGYRWYVDPLDGTTNFAHSFPVFNVTMALESAGELIAGVIFDPIKNELFTAERGAGSYLNNRRIRVSQTRKLQDALVATGFPSVKRRDSGIVGKIAKYNAKSIGTSRILGSRDGWPNEMRDRRAADECEELAPFYSIGLHSLPPARNLWQHSALARIKSGVLRCEILARPISAWGSLSTEAAAPAARPTSASPQKLTSVPNEKFGRDGPAKSHALQQRASYSITSSARAMSVGGTWRPSALAVFRLITNSNFIGAWTGSSLGFEPLSMQRRPLSKVI